MPADTMMDRLVVEAAYDMVCQRLKSLEYLGVGALTQDGKILVSGEIDVRSIVRAVLEGLKNPTDAMMEAAPTETGADGQKYLVGLHYVWNAMLDEAMK